MALEPEFWIAAAFVILVALAIFLKVDRSVMASLDERGRQIRSELDDARQLRDEAHAILVETGRKREEVMREAEAVLEAAKVQAGHLSADAQVRAEGYVRRRMKLAAARIEQAEMQALADIRSAAANVAVAAVEGLLRGEEGARMSERILARDIEALKSGFYDGHSEARAA
jgi:F-type H+-transporting ATPase subunit b